MKDKFQSNSDIIQAQIEHLATLIDEDRPKYTRRPFTIPYAKSRQWLKEKMIASGLDVHIDHASNLVGVRKGRQPHLPPLMIGSHTDSVVGGGRFDGVIGVLAGIEISRQLSENNAELEHTLFIVDFTAEEASEFGISTIGSRGMIGELSERDLNRELPDGLNLRQALASLGGKPDVLKDEHWQQGDLNLYLELHIEQGPLLEQTGHDLGVVTGIIGIRRLKVTIKGEANHAGTTPMHMRKDALAASSEVILAIEESANQPFAEELIGTVGRLFVEPNASNVIPGQVTFEFELRSLSREVMDEATHIVKEKIKDIAAKRNVTIKTEQLSLSEPIKINDDILAGIEQSCEKVGKSLKLPSGAGHDADQIANIGPVGMIFVPSENGISHSAEEWTDYHQVVKGIHALWHALFYFDHKMKRGDDSPVSPL